MVTRRTLFGASAAASAVLLTAGSPALAGTKKQNTKKSENGWVVNPNAIGIYRIEGSKESVMLRSGAAATVLLHIARRWHYEIAPLDEGDGGVVGYAPSRKVRAPFESNYHSGTAIMLFPRAYPVGGSERPWPWQESVIRDILTDCAGTVAWGGDLKPAAYSHFHVAAVPDDRHLWKVAQTLDVNRAPELRVQLPGMVADPASPARRALAKAQKRVR